MNLQKGLAWLFKKGVIYGTISDVLTVRRSKRMQKKLGTLLGVVKCLIPVHSQRVLYEYYNKDPRFMQLTLLNIEWFLGDSHDEKKEVY